MYNIMAYAGSIIHLIISQHQWRIFGGGGGGGFLGFHGAPLWAGPSTKKY